MLAQETIIRSAAPTEISACMQTLTRAFASDPVCQWAWPDTARYRQAFPLFCQAFGGAAFEAGMAHIEYDGNGVALWLAPGVHPDDEAVVATIRDSAPAHLQGPLFSLFEQMDAYHPREPHWHLPLIGVDPTAQGQGVGSALLRHALKTCDREQTVAYLEATSPANMRLYERHGFRAIGHIQAADSPPIIPMVRRPNLERET